MPISLSACEPVGTEARRPVGTPARLELAMLAAAAARGSIIAPPPAL